MTPKIDRPVSSGWYWLERGEKLEVAYHSGGHYRIVGSAAMYRVRGHETWFGPIHPPSKPATLADTYKASGLGSFRGQ